MNGRLEEIIERYTEAILNDGYFNDLINITTKDYMWLIEQAERVQELESENKALHVACRTMDKSHETKDAKVLSALKSKSNYRKNRNKLQIQVDNLEQQNKRYQEALESIAKATSHNKLWKLTAIQALGSESD